MLNVIMFRGLMDACKVVNIFLKAYSLMNLQKQKQKQDAQHIFNSKYNIK